MLQPHSPLWHYLWVGPNLLLLCLGGILLFKPKSRKELPAFLVFCFVASLSELAVYGADVIPTITPLQFWMTDWAALVAEGIVKFVLIGEIFARAFNSYSSLARLGRILIRTVGVGLVMTSAIAAALAPKNGSFGIVAGAHLLNQTIYLISCGLLLFIFVFASYFHLSLDRSSFGIAIGLGISSCVHLATWAPMANGDLPNSIRNQLDFVNMATYHFCVLIWFFYLLVPGTVVAKSAVPLPENNLAVWNRELERLLQQ